LREIKATVRAYTLAVPTVTAVDAADGGVMFGAIPTPTLVAILVLVLFVFAGRSLLK
jgi:hypothetical protein